MVEILWLHLFLVCLPVIEVVEVGNNDRHRERDRQHAGNGTQGPYYFSPHTYWPVCFQKIIESILVWRENSGNNNNKRTFILREEKVKNSLQKFASSKFESHLAAQKKNILKWVSVEAFPDLFSSLLPWNRRGLAFPRDFWKQKNLIDLSWRSGLICFTQKPLGVPWD